MTFDSCGNCRKAMAGPSPQLFRAMLSFLSASFSKLISDGCGSCRCCHEAMSCLSLLLVFYSFCDVEFLPVDL